MPESKKMWRLGLIGWPLEHSWSPMIHQAALRSLGWTGTYSLFPVPETRTGKLRSVCEVVRAGELDGLNVTIPYKETMTVWLDDLTPAARQIGAVNTLFFSDGRLIGDNTDALGFIQDLQVCFGTGFLEKAGTALVLGAGGAARAVVYGLREAGWAVVIAARRPAQAQKMVRDLGGEDGCLEAVELARDEISRIQPDLVVNATPLGMWPAAAVSPWPEGLPFPEGARFYDLIYNPPETKLMGLVRRQGGQVAGGAGMLASQAVLSFRRWTGVTPRLAAMRAVLERALLTDDDAEVLDE